MKKFGLWLLKNNIHVMTFVFIVVACWSVLNWKSLPLILKLNLGAYALLIIHEYEEGYKGRFLALFERMLELDFSRLTPGVTHIAQACFISVLFILPYFWGEVQAFAFAGFILCIFEGFVHTMGIKLFKLNKPSPGWYTACLMFIYAICAIVFFNSQVDYNRIQWLWAIIWYVCAFVCLEMAFQHLIGSSFRRMKEKMIPYAKKNLFNR